MAKGSISTSLLDFSIPRWVADNFYSCEGGTIPRWLLYELYLESGSPDCKDRVNPSIFGKFVRFVFPDLRTRRLGKRGNSRYHYDGLAIKKNSPFYARYCSLLSENNNGRDSSQGEVSSFTQQPNTYVITSGNACSSGVVCYYTNDSQNEGNYFPAVIYLKTEEEMPWPELSRSYLWEQGVGTNYPYEMVTLLANGYYSHCQEILHMVRNCEFHKVEGCIMSFWRSLRPEGIARLPLPDVCQLLKCYDRHLFKEIENILFNDFLEEVSMQYMKSIRLFSENVHVWLLKAVNNFPLLIQTSKSEEAALFKKRLRRKTDLSNMAKTIRAILNSSSRVTALRSNLREILNQGLLEVTGNFFQTNCMSPEELQNDIGLKCLNDLLALLSPYTDIRVLLNCVSSNLQAFVIKPSRSKEELRKLTSDFQLKWNFLLSAVSKAMTLNCGQSFGHWHLFSLLLLDYVAHVFLSYTEKEEDENLWLAMENQTSVLWLHEPSHLCEYFAEEQPQDDAPLTALTTVMQSQNNFGLSNNYPEF